MGRFRDLKLTLGNVWHLPTFVVGVLALLLMTTFWQDPFDLEKGSGAKVEARITKMSSSANNKYQGRWPGLRVAARTEDGAYGITTALPADLEGCKVGDRITARRSGQKLYLEPRPCE